MNKLLLIGTLQNTNYHMSGTYVTKFSLFRISNKVFHTLNIQIKKRQTSVIKVMFNINLKVIIFIGWPKNRGIMTLYSIAGSMSLSFSNVISKTPINGKVLSVTQKFKRVEKLTQILHLLLGGTF